MSKFLLALSLAATLAGCASAPRTPSEAAAPATTARTEGALVYDGMPPLDLSLKEQLRPYLEARTATFKGWLPEDGGVVILTRFGDSNQIHKVVQAEGARQQLTFFDEPVADVAISADASINGLIFTRDSGGDENFQLYFQRLDTLTIRPLTQNQARNERPLFARSSGMYAFASSARNGRDIDVWVGNVDDPAPPHVVTESAGTWFPMDFSADNRFLLVQNYVSITDSTLHVLDLESGELKPLLPNQRRPAANPQARFAHDGQGVYYLSDQGDDIVELHYLDGASGRSTLLTPRRSWDLTEFDLAPEDRHVAFIDNLAGSNRITVHALTQPPKELEKPVAEIALHGGVISNVLFNHSGTEVGFQLAGAQIPGDVLSQSLAAKIITRWTRNETGGLNPEQFVVPEMEAATGFDKHLMGLPRQIPGLYYRPPNATTPSPVVVMLHGGPEAQATPGFDPFIQFLVRELGYAVIQPNVRGSSGYGRAYLGLDDGIKRADAVRDVKAWLDWIQYRPELDRKRVVVYGGSYGGFLVLAALANHSDQLAGGIDIVGISNFVSFLENTNPYRRDQRRQEYGDERDPAVRKVLEEVSPLNKVQQMQKPLFVIQGANDPRVPRSESEQIVRALRAAGQEVWYLLANNEGHGFKKKENVDAMRIAVVMWLKKLLSPQPAATTTAPDAE